MYAWLKRRQNLLEEQNFGRLGSVWHAKCVCVCVWYVRVFPECLIPECLIVKMSNPKMSNEVLIRSALTGIEYLFSI